MIAAFCVYDFTDPNLPLQPWLTIREVAEGLARKGHQVHIVTDVETCARLKGVETHSVASLRGSNRAQMEAVLAGIHPDCLVMLPTPLNIVSSGWLGSLPDCRVVGYASYPFYTAAELFRAWKRLPFADVKQYLRHLLVPGLYWKRAMGKGLDALVAQSETTAGRLRQAGEGRLDVHFVAPGIHLPDWPYERRECNETLRLLYMGAARPIRGFDLAVEALAASGAKSIEYRILARGADDAKMRELEERVGRLRGKMEVSIVGGWLDRDALVEEIHAADAVLQPFILVPSEFPVTAMEVIACGTPVIGSRIDGLPSTIGPAGTVVDQASAAALAKAIDQFCNDAATREAWKDGCLARRNAMLDWGRVVDQWEAILGQSQQ